MSYFQLEWVDWTIFIGAFVVSLLIGLYLGCFGTRQKTVSEYVFGNRQMSVLPISVSIALSLISGVTMIALPAEVYTYGFQVGMISLGFIPVYYITAYVFLPVYFTMETSSGFIYLEKRFNKSVRIIVSVLFILQSLLQLPVIMYVPALAFNEVTGINVHFINSIASLICIIYTTLGGLKAVVWTDMVQALLVIGACVSVMILGFVNLGWDNVWQRALIGERLEILTLNPSPFIRNSLWISVYANFFHWLAKVSIDQCNIQKFKAVNSLKEARRVMAGMCVISAFLTTAACILGLVIYANYYQCDPIVAGNVSNSDQLVPYFVMQTMGSLTGLPGIFLAGLFSAALSSTSAKLNTIGATVYNDFVVTYLGRELSDFHAGLIMKSAVLFCGIVGWALVFIVEKLGEILQINYLMDGITEGALLGLFTLGVLFPKCNTIGALFGAAGTVLIMGVICIFTQLASWQGYRSESRPISVDSCSNITIENFPNTHSTEELFILFRLSHFCYAMVGMMITIIIGCVVSFVSHDPNQKEVSENLLCPLVHKKKTSSTSTRQKPKNDQFESRF